MVKSTNALVETTSFIGREAELRELEALTRKSRLLSILGPPGIGKTRLARELGRRAQEHVALTVWFVDLSEAKDATTLAACVSRTLGFELDPRGKPGLEQVGARLAHCGPLLLILDNFEQLVAAAPPSLGEWLTQAPAAQFVVTSREALRLAAEARFYLEAMADDEGATLFVERASNLDPQVRSDTASWPIVLEIVQRLDGLPLAIELAAARAGVMSPQVLRTKLGERFSLLRSGFRDASHRLATLENAIDWSWTLLSQPEQRALCQCGVFRGGFTLSAAEEVVDGAPLPVVDILESLRNKSLLRRLPDVGMEPRFSMYESIQDFALRIGSQDDLEAARTRYIRYFIDVARRLRASWPHRDAVTDLAPVAVEFDNLTEVERCARYRGNPDALLVAEVLDVLLSFRGPFELRAQLLDASIQFADGINDSRYRTRVRDLRACARYELGNLGGALSDTEDALLLTEDPLVKAEVLVTRGRVLAMQGDAQASVTSLEESLKALSQLPGEQEHRTAALTGLAGALHEIGDLSGARRAYKAVHSQNDAKPNLLLGRSLYGGAVLDLETGELAAAHTKLQQAKEVFQQLTATRYAGFAYVCEGVGQVFAGRLLEAERAIEGGLLAPGLQPSFRSPIGSPMRDDSSRMSIKSALIQGIGYCMSRIRFFLNLCTLPKLAPKI